MKKIILSLCFWLAALTALGQTRKPNIVLVLIEDYSWADTGCYGSTLRITKVESDWPSGKMA